MFSNIVLVSSSKFVYLLCLVTQGFAIGNGLTDPLVQYKAYTDYALDNGLIKESDYKNINRRLPACETAIKLCGNVTDFVSFIGSYIIIITRSIPYIVVASMVYLME